MSFVRTYIMPLICPKGTSIGYRVKTTKKGKKLRFGGCMKKGKFIKKGVKEVKKLKIKK